MDAIFDGLADVSSKPRRTGREGDPALIARSAFALYYFQLISWLGSGFDRTWCMRAAARSAVASYDDGDRPCSENEETPKVHAERVVTLVKQLLQLFIVANDENYALAA